MKKKNKSRSGFKEAQLDFPQSVKYNKRNSHTQVLMPLAAMEKPMMNLDRLISSSRTCTTLEFSLAQNHMFSSGQQGEEELGQEFGQSFFVIAFGSGDKMLHFFMVD